MILIILSTFSASTTNYAYQKSTTQSSVDWGGEAGRAVDGNRDANYFHNSCSHTSSEWEPWWMVDLGQSVSVFKVYIVNRGYISINRLQNFQIDIGELTHASCQLNCHLYTREHSVEKGERRNGRTVVEKEVKGDRRGGRGGRGGREKRIGGHTNSLVIFYEKIMQKTATVGFLDFMVTINMMIIMMMIDDDGDDTVAAA